MKTRGDPPQGEELNQAQQKAYQALKDGQSFESDFTGAPLDECRSWALRQHNNPAMDADSIAIVDAQSIRDQTVTLELYVSGVENKALRRDQRPDSWHGFRVPYQKLFQLLAQITEDFDETWGVCFHRKEELTDENGVFDLDRAIELIIQGEGFVDIAEDDGP